MINASGENRRSRKGGAPTIRSWIPWNMPRSWHGRLVVLLCATIAAIAGQGAPNASAALIHPYTGQSFGPAGLSAGVFSDPQSVTVEQSSGDVYVYDAGFEGGSIYKFDAAGEPVDFSALGADAIEHVGEVFNGESEIAVDGSGGPDSGDIYFASAESGAHNVLIYNAAGERVGEISEKAGTPWGYKPCGVAVDPAGSVYVGLYPEHVNKYTPTSGTVSDADYVSSLSGLEGICNIAADSAEDIYAARLGGGVSKYEASQFNALEVPAIGTPIDPEKGNTLAVDPASNGDVYIDEESDVAAYEPSGSPLGTFGASGPGALSGSFGVAIKSGPGGEVYVDDGEGENAGRVEIFASLVVPDVSIEAPSNLRPGGITLNGTVNPDNAGEATCQFEYGASTAYGHTARCPHAIPSGDSAVPVSANVSGLEPGTVYHYRLAATNANGTNFSQDGELTTSGPTIIEASAANVTATSAELRAQIDPNGKGTAYSFEYGTEAGSYTASMPVPDESIGSGVSGVPVSVQVQGLAPHTTYHYRVAAVQGSEAFDGPDQTFTTHLAGGELALPDARVWELVSPPNKHGALLAPLDHEDGVIQAAEAGNAMTYLATAPTESAAASDDSGIQVFSTREQDGGWISHDIVTPHSSLTAGTSVSLSKGDEYRFFSSDLALGLVEPFGESSSLSPKAAMYLRDDDNGSYQALPGHEFLGATPDLSHFVFRSEEPGLDPRYPTAGGLYEWAGGQVLLASVLPDGEPAEGGVGLGENDGYDARNAISSAAPHDGSRVFWSGTAESGGETHLYMRDTETGSTLQIDANQGGQGIRGEGSAGPRFQTASGDGSMVFFTDAERLTPDSTASGSEYPAVEDLYVYDIEDGKLTDLTVGSSNDEHAGVQGDVLGASEDGSYVYFVANGVLAAGGASGNCQSAEGGGRVPAQETCNLYVSHYDGTSWTTTFIATLSGEDANDWADLRELTARVSPDGNYLAFMSDRSLTGYDNKDANSGEPDEEVFLYDAVSNRVVCTSCNPTGARPIGALEAKAGGSTEGEVELLGVGFAEWEGRWLAANIPGWTAYTLTDALYQSRYLSDSGRLFFNSTDALVPQDVNGTEDVYEYEPPGVGSCESASSTFSERSGGCVSLISSGTSDEQAAFLDASASGDDAFFLTGAALVPQDVDTSRDVYDAHVCSEAAPCSTAPAASPPCDTADSCRTAPAPQPTIFGPSGSATFSGAGNSTPVPTAVVKSKAKPLTRAQKPSRALKACKKKPKKKRVACEKQARRAYGPARKATKSRKGDR